MEKYIIAPPAGSQTNALGAKDRPWEEVHANRYPGINEYLAESTGYGIVSGCEPSISGLTVKVGAGVIHLADGTRKEIVQTNITLDNADPTNPRIDLVYIDSTGAVAKITGTASASPSTPVLPSGGVSVAQVSVASGATTGIVYDKRNLIEFWHESGVANVKSYGAIGDGITDDTNAIITAIKSLKNKGETNLIFPQGVYKISSPIYIDYTLNIFGYGASIHNVGESDALCVGTSIEIWNGHKCTIKGLTVSGNTSSGNGLKINGMLCSLYECRFTQNGLSGILGESAQYARIENCTFTENGRYGIELINGNQNNSNNDIVILGCYECIRNKLGGYYLSASKMFFARNTFTVWHDGCKRVGLYAEGWNSLYIENGFEVEGGIDEDVNLVTINSGPLVSEFSNNTLEGSNAPNLTPLRITGGFVKVTCNNFNIDNTGHKYIEIDNGQVIEENNAYPNADRWPTEKMYMRTMAQACYVQKTISPTYESPLYKGNVELTFSQDGVYLVSIYAKAGGGASDHACQVNLICTYKKEGSFPVFNATALSSLNSPSGTVYTSAPVTTNAGKVTVTVNCGHPGNIVANCAILPIMLNLEKIVSQQTNYVS